MKASDSTSFSYPAPSAHRQQLLFFLVAFIAFALDQTTKFFVGMAYQNYPVPLLWGIDGIFTVRVASNNGGAFSIGAGQTIFFIIVAIAVIVAVTCCVLYRTRPSKGNHEKRSTKGNHKTGATRDNFSRNFKASKSHSRKESGTGHKNEFDGREVKSGLSFPLLLAAGLIVGGALGNLIDRLLAGSVMDFLSFDFLSFPIFNVADIAITFGFIIGSIAFVRENVKDSERK